MAGEERKVMAAEIAGLQVDVDTLNARLQQLDDRMTRLVSDLGDECVPLPVLVVLCITDTWDRVRTGKLFIGDRWVLEQHPQAFVIWEIS